MCLYTQQWSLPCYKICVWISHFWIHSLLVIRAHCWRQKLFCTVSAKEQERGWCRCMFCPRPNKKQNRDMQIIWKKQWNREQSADMTEQSERNEEGNELTKRWNRKRPVFMPNAFALQSSYLPFQSRNSSSKTLSFPSLLLLLPFMFI